MKNVKTTGALQKLIEAWKRNEIIHQGVKQPLVYYTESQAYANKLYNIITADDFFRAQIRMKIMFIHPKMGSAIY